MICKVLEGEKKLSIKSLKPKNKRKHYNRHAFKYY